jgi:putative ABC transport system permease protein
MTDLRLAFRTMAGRPGMSALAIVALALGIGLTTVMFSIVNGVILRGLPFEDSDRIYHFARLNAERSANDDDEPATMHDYVDWSARQHSFEELAAFRRGNANVVGRDGTPVRYFGSWVSANTFHLLRVQPLLGRDFRPEDSKVGAEPVAIIGDKVWQERFDRSPDAIGQTLRINGIQTTVVGVMPPKFGFPQEQELWVAETVDAPPATRAGSMRLGVIGRLPEGASLEQAQAEMATIAKQLQTEYPDTNKGIGIVVKTYIAQFIPDRIRSTFIAMMIAVLGVLIIACANVANLVLARAAERTREVAMRTALGASRFRVIRQMLVEVLLLAVVGALLGLGIAWVGTNLFMRAIVDTNPPFWIDVRIDRMVLLFVTSITVIATLTAGLVPALRASRTELAAILSDEGRVTSLRLGRLSRGLVIAEMALSFGLLVVSVLMIQSILNVGRVDLGFDASRVWEGRVTLPTTDYPDDDRKRQFADALLARLQALPGVEGAVLSTSMPPSGGRLLVKFPGQAVTNERDYPQARSVTISPSFFNVLRVGVEGRTFDGRDNEKAAAVALVNRAFAAKYFPNGAIGQQFALVRGDHQEWRTIVGVTPDLSARDLNQGEVPETFFLPLAQAPPASLAIALRTTGPPLPITSAAREAVRLVDPNMPVSGVNSLEQAMYEQGWPYRVFGSLFTAFGFAALFLATVGLYGVMAFSVSRRTQEVGVRMAMGANGRDVLTMVLRQGVAQVAIGIAIGVGLGAGLGSAMKALLFNASPFDVRVFLSVGVVLTLTALAACLVPARRAAGLDPMVALRRQ